MENDRAIVDFAGFSKKDADWVSWRELKLFCEEIEKLGKKKKQDLGMGKEHRFNEKVSLCMHDFGFGKGKELCFKFEKGGLLAKSLLEDVSDKQVGFWLGAEGRISGKSKIGEECLIDSTIHDSVIKDESKILNNGGKQEVIGCYVPELLKLKGTKGKRITARNKMLVLGLKISEMPNYKVGVSDLLAAKMLRSRILDLAKKGRKFNPKAVNRINRILSEAKLSVFKAKQSGKMDTPKPPTQVKGY